MLISNQYRSMNKALHSKEYYGAGGEGWVDVATELLKRYPGATILDYGCGKGKLAAAVRKKHDVGIFEYDPAIEGKDAPPNPADIIICTDVLEHVEPECLNEVLQDIHRVTKQIAFLAISLRLAKKTLPDGRNAHLIVQPKAWWEARLNEAGFVIKSAQDNIKPETVCFIVRRQHELPDNRSGI